MNICVESLYTLDGSTDKRRMMDMIQVMKGAIYLSKSQTGEVIYRYNRYEKKSLEKQLANFDKGIHRAENDAENQKRDILRKWNLVFGKKRGVAESIKSFDQMLKTAIELRNITKHDGYEEPTVLQEPLHTAMEENKTLSDDANLNDIISVKHTDNRRTSISRLLQDRPRKSARMFQKPTLPMLPRTRLGVSRNNSGGIAEELEALSRKEVADARRKGLPVFQRSMIHAFIQKQNNLHEDLLTRNVVCKIKTNLNTEHPFYKHRLKGKLPNSASLLVQMIERQRTESRLNSHCSSPNFKYPRTTIGNISVRTDIKCISMPNTARKFEKSFSNMRTRTVNLT